MIKKENETELRNGLRIILQQFPLELNCNIFFKFDRIKFMMRLRKKSGYLPVFS